MRYFSGTSVSFDVGHQVPHPVKCLRAHGHECWVHVSMAGSPMPEFGSFIVDMDALTNDLLGIGVELQGRSLNEMISPAAPTAAGLAGWVFSRLASAYPVLHSVEVELGDDHARIEA